MAQGFILEVSISRVGSELDSDVLAGATTLPVIDISQFTDDTGLDVDQVEVAGAVLAVTGYNPALSTLTVLVGPDTALDAGTAVYPLPAVREKWAMVEVNGEDEPVSALVGGDFYDRITDGVRDPEEQEPVVIELRDGDWTITNLVGDEPTLDGNFIDPNTAPPSPLKTDGLPPSTSPAVTANGGIESLYLSWAAVSNPDPVTYDVYVSTVTGFTPGAANLAGSTEATVFSKTYAAGTYYVRVVARDPDGSAPPSAEVAVTAKAPVDEAAINAKVNARPRVIFAATQPTGLTADERVTWYDTSNGYAASYWDGTAWSPYQLSTGALAPNSVTSTLLAAGSVVAGKIGALAVTAAEIAAASITTAKIAADAVTAAEIATGAVTSSELGAGAVVSAALAANAVTTAAIAADAVQAAQIAASAVGSSELATGAVIAGKITAGTIVAGDISAGAITAGKIAAGAVTATELAAGAVTAGKVAANAITATELAAGAVTAGKIAAGTIVAGDISAGAITAGKIAAGAVTATELAAGSVVAGKIAAGAVTAESLTVGTLGVDLVPDGGFEDGGAWTLTNGGTIVAAAARSGGKGLRLGASGGPQAASRAFPVAAGDLISITAWANGTTTPTGLYLRLSWRNAAGSEIGISDSPQNWNVPAGWSQHQGTFAAAPAGTVNAVFQIYNTGGAVDVDDISVRKVVVSAQIADGAITAAKVLAGAITAGKVAAGAISTNELAADSVVSAKIAAGTIVASDIATDTITAGQIAAGAIATSELAAGAVTANNIAAGTITATQIAAGTITATQIASGTITASQIAAGAITTSLLAADAITGQTITGGIFRTAASGQRMEIDSAKSRNWINFVNGVAGELLPTGFSPGSVPGISSYVINSGLSTETMYFYISAPEYSASTAVQPYVSLRSYKSGITQASIGASDEVKLSVVSGKVVLDPSTYVENPSTGFRGKGEFHTNHLSGTGGGFFDDAYSGGGSTAANINTNGRIVRATSSLRYKKYVHDLTIDEARLALGLRAVTFVPKVDAEMGCRRLPGFIAEEADQAGAKLWVTYTGDDDALGIPDGFRYGELTAAHNVLIKDLFARVEALESVAAPPA